MLRRRRFAVTELVCCSRSTRPTVPRRQSEHQLRVTRQRQRSGFTLLELLVVCVIAGIIIAITGKGLASAYAGNSRTSASRMAGTSLFQARAIAIQRSQKSYLVRNGNTLIIYGDSSGTRVQIGKTLDLNQRYGVTLGSNIAPAVSRDSVMFDSRGLITGTTPLYKIYITKGSTADTVCATGLGNTRARGC